MEADWEPVELFEDGGDVLCGWSSGPVEVYGGICAVNHREVHYNNRNGT